MKTIKGNLLNQITGIIVHGVNCQGVMGGGIAAQIRAKYPQVYKDYMEQFNLTKEKYITDLGYFDTRNLLGQVVYTQIKPDLVIASAFTQDMFGTSRHHVYANYAAIKDCFKKISEDVRVSENYGDIKRTIKFPLIGAGLANGDWNVIREIIEEQTQGLETELYVI
jgi:O-acetyl-ADP-ribose deacetylase (regulator of RNase III)